MIKGLGLSGRLMEAGKIKIGIKGVEIKSAQGNKFRPPKKLDHFIITTTERDENGDFVVDEALMSKLKESDDLVNNKGNLVCIPVRLLYDDIEKNFPTTLMSYVSGQMNCRGDGEKSFKAMTKFEKETKCPCDRIDPEYKKDDKCKPFGTLTCFIDGVGLFGQAHMFRTTSANSVNGILGGMMLVAHTTNNRLAGLPLMLTLTAKTSIIPGTTTKTTIHVVSICYRGSMGDLRKTALIEYEDKQKYLEAITSHDSKDEKDIVEEFFPEARGKQSQTIISDTEKDPEENTEVIKDPESVNTGSGKVMDDNDGVVDVSDEDNTEGSTGESTDTESGPSSILIDLGFTPEYGEKIKPAGKNEKLYIRLIEATDIKTASKLTARLMRTDLLYFLVDQYPQAIPADFDIKIKKPELISFIRQQLVQSLKPSGDDSGDESTDNTNTGEENEKGQVIEEKKEQPQPPRSWDDSGEVTKEQLRLMLLLKHKLEETGVIKRDPIVWGKLVAFFMDKDGSLVKTAKGLTIIQGFGFIKLLDYAQISSGRVDVAAAIAKFKDTPDDIPF